MKKLILFILYFLFLSLPLYSQWEPLYDESNYDFCTMDFVSDSVGWTAGWNGTLIKTSDGGNTWFSLPLNPDFDIENIDFIDKSIGWATAWQRDTLGFEPIIIKTDDGGYSWAFYNYLQSRPKRLFAVNDSTAYIIAGYQGLYKTNKDSTECLEVQTGLDDSGLSGIWFFNDQRGIITGTKNWEYGLIMWTTDGGLNWQDSVIYDYYSIEKMTFINDSTAYFLASTREESFLCKTEDTCHSWSVVYSDTNGIDDFQESNENIFHIVQGELSDGVYYDRIKRSNDRGSSWETLYSISNWNIVDFYVGTNETGSVICSFRGRYAPSFFWGPTSGSILISNNNTTNNWEIKQIISYPLSDVWFFSQNNGIIGGGSEGFHYAKGGIFITENGGHSWKQGYSTNMTIDKIEFIDPSSGFALLGADYIDDKIIKTTDGGLSWSEIFNGANYDSTSNPEVSFELYDFAIENEDIGWLAGRYESDSSGAAILGTTDGGENWDILWKDLNFWRLRSIFSIGENCWAVGAGIIIKYSIVDGWQTIDNFTDLPLNKVYFIDANKGWISAGYHDPDDSNFKLFKTIDGGEKWKEIPDFNYKINDIYFADSLSGWMVGSDANNFGIILKTIDGGYNWMVEAENIEVPLKAIHFEDGHGWVVGGSTDAEASYPRSIILKTYDGSTWIDESNKKIYTQNFKLSQNYPNPFNPSTTIQYSIPKPEKVKIEVYNTLGQVIETLLNKPMPAGNHEVTFNAQILPSGVYFYRIRVGDPAGQRAKFQDVKKMVLLK